MTETNNSDTNCKVFYFDLYGVRQAKYDFLFNNDIKSVEWEELKPEGDKFYFYPKNQNIQNAYNFGLSIDTIFNQYKVGMVTGNDNLFIDYEKKDLVKKLTTISEFDENKIIDVAYRIFDKRKIYYDQSKLQRARYDIMQHLINNSNFGLIVTRRNRDKRVV